MYPLSMIFIIFWSAHADRSKDEMNLTAEQFQTK